MTKLIHIAVCIVWAVYVVSNCVLSQEPCAKFEFPNGTGLTLHENTTITLPFKITTTEDCNLNKSFVVRVNTCRGDDNNVNAFCSLFHIIGTCEDNEINSTRCTCSSEERLSYTVTHTVTREDNCTWKWDTHPDGHVQEKGIVFNILFPAQIHNLSILQDGNASLQYVHPNTSTEVVCTWDKGNPPVTARLLDRHGVEMEGSIYSSGQIRYRFPAVACQDAGLIRCGAPGASHNQTARLLVKCPPEFVNDTVVISCTPGEDAHLNVSLRTHSTDYLSCRIAKIPSNQTVANCSLLLTGQPPNLWLSGRIGSDVVREEQGHDLRLELTNEAGTGNVTLKCNMTATEDASGPPPNDTPTTQDDSDVSVTAPVVGLIGFLLVVGVVATFFVYRQKDDYTHVRVPGT